MLAFLLACRATTDPAPLRTEPGSDTGTVEPSIEDSATPPLPLDTGAGAIPWTSLLFTLEVSVGEDQLPAVVLDEAALPLPNTLVLELFDAEGGSCHGSWLLPSTYTPPDPPTWWESAVVPSEGTEDCAALYGVSALSLLAAGPLGAGVGPFTELTRQALITDGVPESEIALLAGGVLRADAIPGGDITDYLVSIGWAISDGALTLDADGARVLLAPETLSVPGGIAPGRYRVTTSRPLPAW
ncbi:MAG: hypothetical protein H0V89_09710 [Deltaproteobacteria bacterium]|nr:hypothetical protein [Deltaproteobacteria bacterium]